MADYFWPPLPSTGKPVTVEWGAAVQENPVAIADGAIGAPRVVSRAIGPLYIGQSSVTNTVVQFVGLDAVSAVRVDMLAVSAYGALQISSSNDGGATWGAWTSIAGGGEAGFVIVGLRTGGLGGVASSPSATTPTLITGSVLPSSNGIRFRGTTSGVGAGHSVFITLQGLE